MDVSKNNLEQAIASLRLSRGSSPACCNLEADVDALIAALDAARGQAVAWRYRRYHTESWNSPEWDRGCLVGDGDEWSPLYAAPPAAVVVPDLALMAIGVKHFGPPAPAEWYAAARELLARLAAAQAKGE